MSMSTLRVFGLGATAAAVAIAGCGGSDSISVEMLPVPAAAGAGMYTLTGTGPSTILSWVEARDSVHVLNAARFDGTGWGEPIEVSRGSDWFINWADRPSVVVLPDGAWAAHWLQNNPGHAAAEYVYGIVTAYSNDEGASWQSTMRAGLANDEANEYTGFLSFEPTADGMVAAYLSVPDGPAAEGEEDHVMNLRLATFGATGQLVDDVLLDGQTCSCCPLDLASTASGTVLVYRDRFPGEIRDISIIRRVNGAWTEPASVHADGWMFPGCPTNGPAVAADGDEVAVAWFTGAEDVPSVRLAFSHDGGATFGEALEFGEGQPIGYVDVELVEGRDAVVSWLEHRADGSTDLLIRRLTSAGRSGRAQLVAQVQGGRAGGMPQLGQVEGSLLLAWRDGDDLFSARVSVPASP